MGANSSTSCETKVIPLPYYVRGVKRELYYMTIRFKYISTGITGKTTGGFTRHFVSAYDFSSDSYRKEHVFSDLEMEDEGVNLFQICKMTFIVGKDVPGLIKAKTSKYKNCGNINPNVWHSIDSGITYGDFFSAVNSPN